MMKGVNGFVGCFMRDKVPALKDGQGCIVNLDKSGGPGTHWCCLYNKDGKYYWFDSYGFAPPQELMKFKPVWNKTDYQPLDSDECGYYAMHVLRDGLNGIGMTDSVKKWSKKNLGANDKKVLQQVSAGK